MKNFGKSQLSAKVMMCLLGGMIFTGSLPSMSSAEEVIPVEKEFMLDEIVVTSSRRKLTCLIVSVWLRQRI